MIFLSRQIFQTLAFIAVFALNVPSKNVNVIVCLSGWIHHRNCANLVCTYYAIPMNMVLILMEDGFLSCTFRIDSLSVVLGFISLFTIFSTI